MREIQKGQGDGIRWNDEIIRANHYPRWCGMVHETLIRVWRGKTGWMGKRTGGDSPRWGFKFLQTGVHNFISKSLQERFRHDRGKIAVGWQKVQFGNGSNISGLKPCQSHKDKWPQKQTKAAKNTSRKFRQRKHVSFLRPFAFFCG